MSSTAAWPSRQQACTNGKEMHIKTLVKSYQFIFKLQIATVKQVAKTTADHIQVYFIK
jgi:hypothetical protein